MMTTIVIGGAVALITAVIGLLGYVLRKSIFDKIDKFSEKLECLDDKITDFKTDMLKYYVTKADFEKNENAHKEMWIEFSAIKERLTKLEN